MNAAREIPVSSCPPCYEEYLYSNGGTENEYWDFLSKVLFDRMLARLKARASRHTSAEKRKGQPRIPTRYNRVEQIKAELPGGYFSFCRVNTGNAFEYDGVWRRIDASVKAYRPKHTGSGTLYDMDQIVVVRMPDGMLHYFDQKLNAIDESLINEV
jgi:hypothetical protein